MKVEIISPEKIVFIGEAEAVTLPGANGSFTILNHHAPFVSSLSKGCVGYGSIENKKKIEIEGGLVEVKNNKVVVCVEQK